MNKEIEDFDWVKARAECSVREIFEKLRIQVNKDVDARKNLLPEGSHYGFRFISENDKFVALLEGNNIHKTLLFEHDRNSIKITTDHNREKVLVATLTLSAEGEVCDRDYALWQFRKLVLEPLLFAQV
jgi:hypothetical protein